MIIFRELENREDGLLNGNQAVLKIPQLTANGGEPGH
jgi:hypothetical protein